MLPSQRIPRMFPALALSVGVPFGLATVKPVEATSVQQSQDTTRPDRPPIAVEELVVTATRTPTSVFQIPTPAIVLGATTIRQLAPNTVSDLFRSLPGLGVSGVGAAQVRPTIRGQRGQRILLLEDGLRLNNSRRQQDFGEVPSLVDVATLGRVEVVRGPASVLYGTDAIGGVVNLISRTPTQEGVHGNLGYRYSTHDEQHKGVATLLGRTGRLGFLVSGTYRDAGSYDAPSGSFGNISLGDDARVNDTGVQDESIEALLSYDLSAGHEVFIKYKRYRADTTGFGYVDPAAYAPFLPLIQITYPEQRFDKFSAGYHSSDLGTPLADKLDVSGYYQDNERDLDLGIFFKFGGGAPPGAGVVIQNQNFSDLETYGFRLEATKLIAGAHILKYGVDLFRDKSDNTDRTESAVVGFGPPMPEVDSTPQVPNATFRSLGVFAQGDLRLAERLSIIVGARFQDIQASTRTTPGITDPLVSKSDNTIVGAANVIYGLTDNLNIIGALGRAFRSPNLVERFFSGPTPEGAAFQAPNPDLEAETSLNIDVGLRYEDRLVSLEGFFFRNEIRNGIRIASTSDTINMLPVFQNVNVDKLRFTGVELAGSVRLPVGVSVHANYTHLSSKDVLNPLIPVGETFSDNLTARARYTEPQGRFWAEYAVRYNGDQKDVALGTNPVGDVLPAFTVHTARAGATLFRQGQFTQRVAVTLANFTNALYAETANASFFRPEPGRHLLITLDTSF
ncbi:MAG: TonB-dependent receptor [Gemmatimonadales bacterium]|nr:TonB-dependent receptor [Gemmatimonadales bacterium]